MSETWFDRVHKYYPNASDKECESVLWNATCFPFGTIEMVDRQLRNGSRKSHRNPTRACYLADRSMSREYDRYARSQPKE